MSRIGKMPVEIPQGVTVDVKGSTVSAKGPRGQLTKTFHPDMEIRVEDGVRPGAGQVVVSRPTDSRDHRALHGLTRALIANMVTGVSQGFRRDLSIEGVGYRAEMRGRNLVLNVGYSHPVEIEPPQDVEISVERGAKQVTVEGLDKEVVGELAAKIRAVRPPEPYKGKGIRYADEYVRRKAGKAGKIGA
jgi:large subunit ribosomal protein L6